MRIAPNYQMQTLSNYKLINQSKQTTPSFGMNDLKYDILKRKIMNGEHKTLPDGTIRQYIVRTISSVKQQMGNNKYRYEPTAIPIRDLFLDGRIVEYADIPPNKIRSGKRFHILEDGTPVDSLKDVTIYYPNGRIVRIERGKLTKLV